MRSVIYGLTVLVLSARLGGQSAPPVAPAPIPAEATALHGSPTVRVETDIGETRRHVLTAAEAGKHGLRVSVVDGRYFWTSRQNEELTLTAAGEFTYLTGANPGQYIRLRRISDRLTYVEHLEMDTRSVTYYGELRVVLGSQRR